MALRALNTLSPGCSKIFDETMTASGTSLLSEMAVFAANLGGITATGPESNLTLAQANINPAVPAPYNGNTMTVGAYFALPKWGEFAAAVVGPTFIFGPAFPKTQSGQSMEMLHEMLHLVLGSHLEIASALNITLPPPIPGFEGNPNWPEFAASGAMNK